MRYGILFLGLSVSCAVLSAFYQALAWLLLWPAVSFALVGVAYLGLGPRVFGKRPDGSLSWWAVALLAPYLALAWSVWAYARWLSSEPPCNEVAPGIWLGRRALAAELPPEIDLVVDLCAELWEPKAVVRQSTYLSLPTLDASVPDAGAFREAVKRIATWRGRVYIHCAMGHGRSATLAAAVLLARKLAADPAAAIKLLRTARPGVGLKPVQRWLLETLSIDP